MRKNYVIDSSLLIAYWNTKDINHKKALEIFEDEKCKFKMHKNNRVIMDW